MSIETMKTVTGDIVSFFSQNEKSVLVVLDGTDIHVVNVFGKWRAGNKYVALLPVIDGITIKKSMIPGLKRALTFEVKDDLRERREDDA